MKIYVGITVDVDPDAWELNYGVDQDDKPALREDVKRYCYGQISESAAADAGAMEIVRAR